MNPTLEIFSQGEEIVTGQTVDSNSAWLSEQAVHMGFTVTRHTAVGDKLGDLVDLLREIFHTRRLLPVYRRARDQPSMI